MMPPKVAPRTPRQVAPSFRAPMAEAKYSSANERIIKIAMMMRIEIGTLLSPIQRKCMSAPRNTKGVLGRAGTRLPKMPATIRRHARAMAR